MKRSSPTTHSTAVTNPIFKMEDKTIEEQTRAEMLIELAIKNYSRGLIANAEHFLHLVQAMYPCDKADKLLKSIQKSTADGTEQGDSKLIDNLIDSVQFLEIANDENLNKRKQLKAKRPKLLIDCESDSDSQSEYETQSERLTYFRAGSTSVANKVKRTSNVLMPGSNGVEYDNEEEMAESDEIEDTNEIAAERITRALKSLLIKKYNVAVKVLERAHISFPRNELICGLSKQVKKEMKIIKTIAPGKECQHPKADFYAAAYIILAVQASHIKDFDNAIMLCQLAENWHDSQDSRKTYISILKEMMPMDRKLIYFVHSLNKNECLTVFGMNLEKAESLYYDKNDKKAEKELRYCYREALPKYVVELKKLICSKIDAEENYVFDDEEDMEDSGDIEDSDETADERIARALNCLLVKDYNVADKVLGRAHKLFPGNELIYGLRKQVKKEMEIIKKIPPRKERKHRNAEYYAAEYIFLAIYAKNIKDYDNAILLCQLAENWCDNEASRKIYTYILKEKFPPWQRIYDKGSNQTQYGTDLRKAESLYYDKNNKEAEIALRKCYLTPLPKYVVKLSELICSKIETEGNNDDDNVIILE